MGIAAGAGHDVADRGPAVPLTTPSGSPSGISDDEIAAVFRAEHGRAVAVLTRAFRSLDVAEEAVQDAFVAAVEHWPREGVPPSPAGWIITTARRKAIDRLRREASRDDRHAEAALLYAQEHVEVGPVRDDQLRLVFTCCHPALAPEAQVALTLRMVGGLTTEQIAHAFLVPVPTMQQRLVRAKGKIRDARIPYRVPADPDLPDRLRSVLAVVYLVFTEGHQASSGPAVMREDLCADAIRLGRLMVELMPDEPEAAGLLALMLLVDARRPARSDSGLVLLADQDRTLWDRAMLDEGLALVRESLRRNQPGPYQLQAAIQAVHASAPTASLTQWWQVVALYDQLLAVTPTPVVALNRAVAVAEVDGPAAGLALVDGLPLQHFALFHSVRADFLRRLDRSEEAAAEYERASALTENDAEREFLESRRDALTRGVSGAGS